MSSHTTYINIIDECVNNIIDSFYLEFLDDKQFKKKISSDNFILEKFDEIINKVKLLIDRKVIEYKINEIITNQDEYNKIIELFNDYVLLYFFFYVGSIFDLDKCINLLNKLNNKYQINFFRNRYLTQFSIYYKYINDYYKVLENQTIESLETKIESGNNHKDIIDSIKTIDMEVLKNIIDNKQDLMHNILKMIIFRDIYMKEDKIMIFKILENEEFANAEFKYIEIVDTKYDMIDYATIESLFDIKDIKRGFAEEIYQMINEYEVTKYTPDYTIETKINQLFKKGILIPITDEFLRFHKEIEVYDKGASTKIDPSEKVSKKGDTKIRYIVTRVNKVKDYYSTKVMADPTSRREIEKIFYQPLLYRKAIIINDLEEINILKKLELQGKSVTDVNEFYEDLKQLRSYPFIEFRFANKDSFSFVSDSTVDAIRYCNFEYKDDSKFSNIGNTIIQYRVINDTMKANIVGVAIPRYNLINTNNVDRYNQTIVPCHYVKDTFDMSKLHKNAFAVTIKKLRKLFMEDRRYSKLLYWLFDKKNDTIKLDLFDNIKQLPKDDYIKLLLGKVYDEMVDITYKIASNKINAFEKIDIKTAKNILSFLESKLVLIPRQSTQYAEIMKLIYYIKAETDADIRDYNEDKIIGTDTQFIKLPRVILEKIAIHIIRISKAEISTEIVDDSDIYEGFLCQHVITWNDIMRYKKSNPNKFNQELFNFIKKYVTENKDGDFVCKSCFQMVDLRKYTTEIFPGSDSIAVSYGLETELETIPEYTKYTKAIKNMDKILEKVCYSSNISYFVGSGQQIKFRRQEVVKNIIDIIDIQYKTLFTKDTNARKDRLDKAIKKYGCSLTNFFLFKLENDIFTYSSKEIDKFKLFKINNILTYILIEIILEINLSQILYLSFDKLANYFLFTKFGFNLFDNLYIRISNKNDVAPIKNYKLLCYVVYYLSGIYAKFNMWYADGIAYKPNNINPQIQRIIIHTFIDALNSILEVNTKDNKHYLYNMFATKLFNKLNTTYNNDASRDIIDKLDNVNKKKVVITVDKKLKYNITSVNAIPFKQYVTDGKYMFTSDWGINKKVTSYPSIKFIHDKLIDPTNEILFGEKKLKELHDELFMNSLLKIASIYGLDGIKRNVPLSIEETKKIPKNELIKIMDVAKETRLKNILKAEKAIEHKLEKIDAKNLKNEKYIKQIREKFNEDISQTIDDFVNKLESLIGKDININNHDYYLHYNAYEIDHDYRGNKKSPIIILDKEQKIKYKQDDTFFGQDIYYYDDTINKVTLYYSAIEKYLIGYKESSKDYVKISNSNCYLKIHYSLRHQLNYLGFNYTNYKLPNKLEKFDNFINNILRIRLQNLKNSLSIIQQIIYQVRNNFTGSYLNPIAKYYQTKIKAINTYNEDGDRIFKDWNIINGSLFSNNINIKSNINIKTMPNKVRYIQTDTLLKYITNNDIILHYIIEQLNLLLDINKDNYTKVTIAYMIINVIFQLYRNFVNFENAFYDINVKKFYHYISTKAAVSETHDEINLSNLSEDELEKLKEEQDIDKERFDALDADQDETNEDFGDEDVLILDRVSGDY